MNLETARLQQAEYMGYDLLHKLARTALVNCWMESSHESSLMWNSYAGTEGVAIRTTFRDLRESLRLMDPEVPATFGRVNYVDYRQEEVPRFGCAPFFHKRLEYHGEKEVRVLLPGPPWKQHLNLDPDKVKISLDPDVAKWRGRQIGVNLQCLVKEILVSPKAKPWFHRLVNTVLDRSPIEISATPSVLGS